MDFIKRMKNFFIKLTCKVDVMPHQLIVIQKTRGSDTLYSSIQARPFTPTNVLRAPHKSVSHISPPPLLNPRFHTLPSLLRIAPHHDSLFTHPHTSTPSHLPYTPTHSHTTTSSSHIHTLPHLHIFPIHPHTPTSYLYTHTLLRHIFTTYSNRHV